MQLSQGRPIACLFCAIPSNFLSATPDLHRIRRSLAAHYHCIVVRDETIGALINVNVLPYVDVIIVSLIKISPEYTMSWKGGKLGFLISMF